MAELAQTLYNIKATWTSHYTAQGQLKKPSKTNYDNFFSLYITPWFLLNQAEWVKTLYWVLLQLEKTLDKYLLTKIPFSLSADIQAK